MRLRTESQLPASARPRRKAYLTGKTVASRFDYDYSEKEIAEVADRTRKLAQNAKDVHVSQQQQSRLRTGAAIRLRKALGQQ